MIRKPSCRPITSSMSVHWREGKVVKSLPMAHPEKFAKMPAPKPDNICEKACHIHCVKAAEFFLPTKKNQISGLGWNYRMFITETSMEFPYLSQPNVWWWYAECQVRENRALYAGYLRKELIRQRRKKQRLFDKKTTTLQMEIALTK